jgi:HlyD family secretion protein
MLPESYQHLVRKVGGRTIVPFRPGMTASVDIITDRKNDVLSVPLNAVTTKTDSTATAGADKSKGPTVRVGRGSRGTPEETAKTAPTDVQEVVFVVRDGKAVMVPVKTGISDITNIEIVSGLKAGDIVASGPYATVHKKLKDGAVVVVKDAKSINKAALKEEVADAN